MISILRLWNWEECQLRGFYRSQTQLPPLDVIVQTASPVQVVEGKEGTAANPMCNISWNVTCVQTLRMVVFILERAAGTCTLDPRNTLQNLKAEHKTKTALSRNTKSRCTMTDRQNLMQKLLECLQNA